MAFDQGLITFDNQGALVVSTKLAKEDAKALGIRSGHRIRLSKRHLPYLDYHRSRVFLNK